MENEFNTQPEEQANEAVSEQPAQASEPSAQQAPQPANPQPQQPYVQQFPQPVNTRLLVIGACISVVLTPFLIGGILGIVVFVFSIMATIDAYHGSIK